jgi:type I restriction enzyme R subunit
MPLQRLSETDICDRFITPALHQAGWLREQILHEHSFTAGRITVRGRLVARGKPRRADYVLLVGQVALAVIEAKDNSQPWAMAAAGAGLRGRLAHPIRIRQ